MITIIPAIDLKNGRCVRLRQGRFDDSTVYSEDPVAMAGFWVEQGATYLHIVDLDGAFEGRPVHSGVITQIVKAIAIPVEVGGGLRTDDDVQRLVDCGVDRAIVGTRALEQPGTLERLVERFGARLAAGIDARGGMVQVRGWTETTPKRAVDLAAEADAAGVRTIISTDTERDGMMGGPNVQAVRKLCARVKCSVVASGGIASVEDVKALQALKCPNLIGAIVGKALYEGRVALRDLKSAEVKHDDIRDG